jgi:ABC-type ATPase with predicted acetyltransferase domain
MSLKTHVNEVFIDEYAYRWRGYLVIGDFTLLLPGFIAQWFKPGDSVELELVSEPHRLDSVNLLTPHDFRLRRIWEDEVINVWPLHSRVYEHRGRRVLAREAYLEEDYVAIAELEQYHYASEKELVAIWKCPICGELTEANTQPKCRRCGATMKIQEIKGSIPPSRFLVLELLDAKPYEPRIIGYVRVDTPVPLMHRKVEAENGRIVVEREIREKVFPPNWIHPTFWPRAYKDFEILMKRYRELRVLYSPRLAKKLVADERAAMIANVDTAAARIARVVIHPDFRGDGIGVLAVRAAVEWIQERRIPEMKRKKHLVETIAQMARYNPFFERAGFIYLWDTAGGRPVLFYPLSEEARRKIEDFLSKDRYASKHGGRLYRSRIGRVQPLSGPIVLRQVSKTYRSILDLSALSPAMRDVLKAFGVEKRIIERAIIKDLDIEIRPGEIVAITGISGAGKTTLLRILIGACARLEEEKYKPSEGEVKVPNNVKLSCMLPGELEPIFGEETILEHIAFKTGDIQAALELLSIMGISDAVLYRAKYGELSTGQKERVKLTSLLAEMPNLLIVDEFAAHLDVETAKRIARRIAKLARNIGLTMILSIHRAELLEELEPDKILHVGYGKVYVEERGSAPPIAPSS